MVAVHELTNVQKFLRIWWQGCLHLFSNENGGNRKPNALGKSILPDIVIVKAD